MAILTVLAIYPLILLSTFLLTPLLSGLPMLLSALISVTIIALLMTYYVMPWITRLFGFWLYPPAKLKQAT